MRLLTLLILFLQVVLVKSLEEVSGYLGDRVTLHSGADPSWTLSIIQWSIFSNNTWIATYQTGKKSTERVPQYKGRLSLNISSGDLTIHNLTANDATDYRVNLINTIHKNLINKISLKVQRRLQMPTIRTVASTPIKGGCLMVLNCSSLDSGIDFSWQVKPPSVDPFTRTDRDSRTTHLLAFINNTQNLIEFTCTSSRNMENASRAVTSKCDVPEEKLHPSGQSMRQRNAVGFVAGGVAGGVITVLLIYCFGGQMNRVTTSVLTRTGNAL